MRTIYIDSEYKCHAINETGEYTAVTTDFFDGKCDQFIEGYRFVPKGCEWTRSDGHVFKGRLITPWKPLTEIDSAQLIYEQNLIAEYSSALSEIEAAVSIPEVCGTMPTIVNIRKQGILSRIAEMISILTASTTD